MFSLSIELIIIFTSTLAFLLEFQLVKLAHRLGIVKQTKRLDRLTLANTIKGRRRTGSKWSLAVSAAVDLDREMKEFYESRRSIMPSESLCSQMALAIQRRWPWLEAVQLPCRDQIDRHLSWLAADLYLVHDWDLISLAPKLPCDLLPDTEQLTYRWSTVDRAILLETLSKPLLQTDYLQTSASDGTKNQAKPAGKQQLDGSRGGRAEKLERVPRQAAEIRTAPLDHYQDHGSMLCVKWITPGQLLQLHARSSLLFYYTQMFPNLATLYFVLLQLLQSRGIIEPHLDARVSSTEAQLGSSYGRPNGPSNSSLSRYALFLMLAAYLFEEQHERESKGVKPGDKSAPSKRDQLVGFLRAFSFTDCNAQAQQISVEPMKDGHCLAELKLVRRPQADGSWLLRVLDPIAAQADCWKSFRTALWVPGELGSANDERCQLDSELERADDLSGHFNALLTKLQSKRAECSLADLFDPKQTSPSSVYEEASLSWASQTAVTSHLDNKTDINWLWLAKRVLIVVALLIAQNIVINYLEELRTGVEEQAYNDLTRMKRSFTQQQQPKAFESSSARDGTHQAEVGQSELVNAEAFLDDEAGDDEDQAMLETMANLLLLGLMSDPSRTVEEDVQLNELLSLFTGAETQANQEHHDELDQASKVIEVRQDSGLDEAEL